MSASPCSVTNILAAGYTTAIGSVTRKFASLLRLAQLLEEAWAVSFPLPDITSLVPVSVIDLSTYTGMIQACPFLNLPPIPTQADLAQLQARVAAAYAQLIESLVRHPFNRLNHLSTQLEKIVAQVSSLLDGSSFVLCSQQACGGSPAQSSPAINQFTNTYLAANGQLLTPSMSASANQVTSLITNVQLLLTSQHEGIIEAPPVVPQVAIPTDHPVPPPPVPYVI